MGNSSVRVECTFHGYDVESDLCNWGAMPSGGGTAPEDKVGQSNMSRGADQPQDGLQVVAAVWRARSGGIAGPVETTAAHTAADFSPVGGADSTPATRATVLGAQETARGLAGALGAKGAWGANHWSVAAAVGDGPGSGDGAPAEPVWWCGPCPGWRDEPTRFGRSISRAGFARGMGIEWNR